MAESQTNINSLFHNQEQLLTVYNKTRALLNNNLVNVNELQRITQLLSARLEQTYNATDPLAHAMSYSIFSRKMDINLWQMKDIVDHYRHQSNLYHRQRMQLERGWLMEDTQKMNSFQFLLLLLKHSQPREFDH